jgi:hypothetical protein
MSTAAINLAFDDFSRVLHDPSHHHESAEPLPALRVALLYGEQLRLPGSSRNMLVLSGKAWVSFGGEDYILGSGDSLSVAEARDGAIISAVGEEDLFFEVT